MQLSQDNENPYDIRSNLSIISTRRRKHDAVRCNSPPWANPRGKDANGNIRRKVRPDHSLMPSLSAGEYLTVRECLQAGKKRTSGRRLRPRNSDRSSPGIEKPARPRNPFIEFPTLVVVAEAATFYIRSRRLMQDARWGLSLVGCHAQNCGLDRLWLHCRSCSTAL